MKKDTAHGHEPTPPREVVAFEVTIDDMRCVTFAETSARARWNAVRGAREAGYYDRRGGWPLSLKARRIPFYDHSPQKAGAGRKCFSPEFVQMGRVSIE